jgi:cytochrome c biogenesis protein CcdA
VRHLLELCIGVGLLAAAAVLWRARKHVAHQVSRNEGRIDRSSFLVGAGIMAVELPTAVPYFAAIAAIVESGHSDSTQIVLLLLYNAAFIAPLVLLLVILALTGSRGVQIAAGARVQLDLWAPRIAPAALVVASVVLLALGVRGLT